jgi:hypothetical protein
MSINKLVSVKNVIINLIDDLGLDHDKYRPMFTNWILWAEKQIGSPYSYVKKHKVLTIKGCYAELPTDAVILQMAIMGDLGDCCGDIFDNTCLGLTNANLTNETYASTAGFLVVDLGNLGTQDNLRFGFVQYLIQNNKIVFNTNYNGQKVTIQYMGVQEDCDGFPLIGENHLEALGEYCKYKFRQRRIRSGIDLGLARDHKQEWHRLAASAKADDLMLNESETKMIGEMVNNPFAGKGLWLGQYPTEGGFY